LFQFIISSILKNFESNIILLPLVPITVNPNENLILFFIFCVNVSALLIILVTSIDVPGIIPSLVISY